MNISRATADVKELPPFAASQKQMNEGRIANDDAGDDEDNVHVVVSVRWSEGANVSVV